ncbi:DUF5682 family protein [Paenibacillus sp. MBLB4367]|uniref:DUF5682 family protein n=1 Tax=Paenibacillus sp. MBLB4367 TaxID=3384767 RepID=UPI003907F798
MAEPVQRMPGDEQLKAARGSGRSDVQPLSEAGMPQGTRDEVAAEASGVQSRAETVAAGEGRIRTLEPSESGTRRSAAGSGQPHIFGIRHLSPGGAVHLRAFLDEVRPSLVLVEGPSDASGLIEQLTSRGVVPPVAILAYTDQLPVRTLLYPFASYSPEYQAFQWAAENGAQAAFIDLPSDAAVALYGKRTFGGEGLPEEQREERQSGLLAYYRRQQAVYGRIAELAEEPDYESYWERHFEHNMNKDAYRSAILEFSRQMRGLSEREEHEFDPGETAVNAVREAYMRRQIREAIESGCPADRIVVVTGAFHASALALSEPGMTDAALRKLPRSSTKLTLMPYSYYKLSTHSGYGAGNPAPAYYELMWACMRHGDLAKMPSLYMSQVAAHLRAEGTFRSTASVIEGVRLAESLASLHGGSLPTWKDLRDAAAVCLGFGELSSISEALARTDVGTAIGSLPEGVSQTPIQDDLNRHLKRLKLDKYKSAVAADLELDLRENRRVKSEEAAFIDLHRSVFLHRLALLDIDFAKKQGIRQDGATWAEHWVLRWSPETEIQLVESTLKGETVELAAAFVIGERLERCGDIREASRIVRAACECGLPEAMEQARQTLQRLAVDAGSFAQIAAAARELSVLIRYGDIRKADTASLVPLMQQLFLRGALLLVDAAACSEEASNEILAAMNEMHAVSQDFPEEVDDGQWLKGLWELASRDDRNARLSGFAFAILLERNQVGSEQTAQEVSRRLSPGIPADLGAGWFEGLSMRNRYALLSRAGLWEQLDTYISSLDGEQFRRSLLFLRRAFGSFEPREKAAIAEMLGEQWGAGGLETGELLQRPLSDEERGMLDELNEFDFGDL